MARTVLIVLLFLSLALCPGNSSAAGEVPGKAGPVVTGNPGDFLLLDAQCGVSHAFFDQALTNLGVPYVRVTIEEELYAGLTGGTAWGAVIIDNYNWSLPADTNAAIRDFIAAGGRVHANSVSWEDATAYAFEASLGWAYETPIEIYRRETGHPLFIRPNAVPDLAADFDTCVFEGHYLGAVGGGQVVADYISGEAAIVIGNGGRTMLFGGTPGMFAGDWDNAPSPLGDGTADGLEYAENAVTYLLTHVFSDGFESGSPSVWSSTNP